MKKYSLEDAVEKFKSLNLTLLADKYIGVTENMPYICNSHPEDGIQYATLSAINQGQVNCKKCRYDKSAKSQRVSDEELIKEFKNVNLIIQEGFVYKEMHDALPCICEKHPELGVQYISYNNIKHNNQKGCIKCGHERLSEEKRMDDSEIKKLVENLDLEYVETIKHKKTKVACICPKHRNYGVQIKFLDKLKHGQGCKYCNISHGERQIEKYLLNNSMNFIPQKEFDGLVGLGKCNLSYDFYLPTYNLLIEFQGEQHKHYIKGFHKTYNDFIKQQEHDRRKREYANSHNIKLLEIWYFDFDNIEEILEKELYLVDK